MATRFYFNESEAAAVSPTLSAAWSHSGGTNTGRRRLQKETPDSSALSTVAVTPDAADHLVAGDSLHRQYVSDPMGAQTISGTVKMNLQCLEANAGNNLFLAYKIFICSQDGTTIKEDVATLTRDTVNEVATSLTNRRIEAVSISTVTIEEGDRIVVEIGLGGTPTAAGGTQGHNGSIRWGGSAAGGDLGENDTDTGTTLRPWIEFSATIVGAAQTVSPSAIATAEAVGTQQANLTVQGTAGGIATAQAFGTAKANLAVQGAAGAIASAEAFGSAKANLTVQGTAGGIATGEAFGGHTIALSGSGQTISPTGIATAEGFQQPLIRSTTHLANASGQTSAVVSRPSGLVDGDLVFILLRLAGTGASAETVTPPSGFEPNGSVGGSHNIRSFWKRASSEPSTWTFSWTNAFDREAIAMRIEGARADPGDPFNPIDGATPTSNQVTAGSQTTLRDNTLIIIGAVLAANATILSADNGWAIVESPNIRLLALSRLFPIAGATGAITAATLSSSVAKSEGIWSLRPSETRVVMSVAPAGVASGEAFGIQRVNLKLVQSSIASAEAFGAAMLRLILSASGIPTAQAVGTAQLNLRALAAALASAEAFGSAVISVAGSGAQTITGAGNIASAQAFGTPSLRMTIVANGIPTAEVFGSAQLGLYVRPTGVASGEQFGTAEVRRITLVVPTGIVSGEAVGTPKINLAALLAGIASGEVFGLLTLEGGETIAGTLHVASVQMTGPAITAVVIIGPALASPSLRGSELSGVAIE